MAIYDASRAICYARGDTVPIAFTLTENSAALNITGFTFSFTVNSSKNPVDVSTELFSIAGVLTDAPNGKVEFRPSTANTDLSPAKYYYDVQMVDTGGFIRTVIKSDFDIEQDIDKA